MAASRRCQHCGGSLPGNVRHRTLLDCVDSLRGRNDFLRSENQRLSTAVNRAQARLAIAQQQLKKYESTAIATERLERVEAMVVQLVAQGGRRESIDAAA